MRLTRIMTTTALSGILSLSAAGVALAADPSTGSITGPTGSDSVNKVSISIDNGSTTTNTNTVNLANVNVQMAKTGNVSAKDNTTVSGPVSSGNATNNAVTSNTVTVDNTGIGGSGGGAGTTPGGGSGGGAGGGAGGGSGATTPGQGGGVLGASTVGGMGGGLGSGSVATLPDTGALNPIDVSALRALYHQPTTTTPVTVAKTTGGISAALLIGASLLSLMGAIGSVMFANRRERRLA